MKSIVYGSYLVLYHSDKDRFNKCNKIDRGDTQDFRFIPDYIKDLKSKLKEKEAECERLRKSNRILADMHVMTVFDYEMNVDKGE